MVAAQNIVSSKPRKQKILCGYISHSMLAKLYTETIMVPYKKGICLLLVFGFWSLVFVQNTSAQDTLPTSPSDSLTVESTQTTDRSDGRVSIIDRFFQIEPFRTILSKFDHNIGFIKFLIILVTILFFNAIFLFLYILLNRAVKTYLRNRNEKLRTTYQSELAYYVSLDEDQPFYFTNLNKRINREIFVEELISLHKSLIGETALRVESLYFEKGFDRDSLGRIRSRSWSKKAKGFRELAQMNVRAATKEILQYTNSSNRILRMEAQLATVKLNSENPLAFLHNLKIHLTLWEQINILNTIQVNNIEIDSLDDVMDSKNHSVAIFAITLCGLFNHLKSWPKVLEKLNHSNPDIRLSAIKALAIFNLIENKQPIKDCFQADVIESNNTKDGFLQEKLTRNKLVALDALEQLLSKDDSDFYMNIFRNRNEDFNVLKKSYQQFIQIEPAASQMLRDGIMELQPALKMLKDYFEYKNHAK
ncbi:MAG TPA: hypothetical protein DCM62_10875 [Bacteroidales bacterium]|nr:hypothetical protein [Bacteroidales bacterium]